MKRAPIHCASLGILAVLLVLIVALIGCEEDVTVSLGTDHAYSLYGFLNPQADTQWIRVYPIEGELLPISSEPLDAHFTSQEMETGEMRVWRDSVITFSEGAARVFWSPFRARYGHTYRLEVERSDGVVTGVEVETPQPVQGVLLPPEITYAHAESDRASQALLPVILQGEAPRMLSVDAEYLMPVDVIPGDTPTSYTVIYDVIRVPYDDRIRREAGQWRVDIDLRRDFLIVRDSLTRRNMWPENGVQITQLTLRMDVVNEEWYVKGGTFDPDVLVQPGAFSNVENGFGFVGSGYRQQMFLLQKDDWDPLEQEAERAAGFNPCPCN